MGVGISYMGTKRHIAPAVCDVVGHAQKGTLLDVFSGMCSIGESVAPARQVWSNDIQIFAAEVARALFTSRDEPLDAVLAADLHFDFYNRHNRVLSEVYRKSLDAEDALLGSTDYEVFAKRKRALSRIRDVEVENAPRRCGDMFTSLYSDSYFGVRQAIEADAIIAAVRNVYCAHAISVDHRRWLVIGLGRALLKLANSTGHFAQYLKPKKSSFRRYVALRQRSLWEEWLSSVEELRAVGTLPWRRLNRCFNQDTLTLLPHLSRSSDRPAVVYADPPYTDDQYSRFYHLFESLVLYDYPATSGNGLYRSNRFSSWFSLRSKAVDALDRLIQATAASGADLILSYPTNGLICESGANPKHLLSRHYRKVECCYSLPYKHSTFGASKGAATSTVTERIYLAKS